ncbi:MAG: hypothetical protein J6W29_02100 [Neisseriaceae bacterium]|nr:hypothetical protein [Neisseriaceae bacterium]
MKDAKIEILNDICRDFVELDNTHNEYGIALAQNRIKMILCLMATVVLLVLAILLQQSSLVINFAIVCCIFCFWSLLNCELISIKNYQNKIENNKIFEENMKKIIEKKFAKKE